jgi:hypothetical protein
LLAFSPQLVPTMATPEEKAAAFKNDGNKAFSAHDWPTAIELYTKAIELNDKEPTYYSNRAQVCCGQFPPGHTTNFTRRILSQRPMDMP